MPLTRGLMPNMYDEIDDFSFPISPIIHFLDGDFPLSPSYGVYLSELFLAHSM